MTCTVYINVWIKKKNVFAVTWWKLVSLPVCKILERLEGMLPTRLSHLVQMYFKSYVYILLVRKKDIDITNINVLYPITARLGSSLEWLSDSCHLLQGAHMPGLNGEQTLLWTPYGNRGQHCTRAPVLGKRNVDL